MSDVPEHVKWLTDTNERLTTVDGITVEVWELFHKPDEKVLSAWAKHFRNHYCLDTQIGELVDGTEHPTRADYLLKIKFPDKKAAPGPSIRAGDFGEILVADFLEYILGYWVPRTRYIDKTVRNESTKGCDIIGFGFIEDGKTSPKDVLAIFEAKAQFSGKKPLSRLQDAIDGSQKDLSRRAESLNAMKQRFLDTKDNKAADKVKRFQQPESNPYVELYGAAALFSADLFDNKIICASVTHIHEKKDQLKLVVIRGKDMMQLVHELYQRAADEA
jgi:hypothetical protein